MTSEIVELSSSEIVAEVFRGAITATAVAEAFLARCQSMADLNAFIAIDAERVLAEAGIRDRDRREGATLGPLHGLPIAVKDNIDVAGYPTTCNTPMLRTEVAATDANIVACLRNAGAVILGKTNMPELALGQPNDPATGGDAVHPSAPDQMTGGSSSGTAVAVAARLAPAGLGTDTGGSIRIPASLCGVAGLRPTVGRWPQHGLTVLSPTCDTAGPMARDIADLALFDAAITSDRNTAAIDPRNLRLGVPRQYFFDDLDPGVEQVIESALSKLCEAGVVLVEVEVLKITELSSGAGLPISLYEAIISLEDIAGSCSLDLAAFVDTLASPATRDMLAAILSEGLLPEAPYRAAIEEHRPRLRRELTRCLLDHDVAALIFPTTPLPTRPLTQWDRLRHNGRDVATFEIYVRNTTPGAAAGFPGLTVPAGTTADGLPVGLALEGAEHEDRRLLSVGIACAAALVI